MCHGSAGLLLPQGDAAALASALQLLIDDPPVEQRTRSQARRRIEQLVSAEVVVSKLDAALRAHCVGGEKSMATG